jgi:TetR/AcrR family tetracycline transcriptional repressor
MPPTTTAKLAAAKETAATVDPGVADKVDVASGSGPAEQPASDDSGAEKPISRRAPLTRERIMRSALEIAERDGIEALSMRRLAKEFGVEAMSLYNHVHGKADILDGIAEVVLDELELPEALPNNWEDGIRVLAHAFRSVALAHPRSCAVVLTRKVFSPSGLRPMEASVSLLLGAGFDEATAVHSIRVLMSFLVGSLLRQVGVLPTLGGQDPASAEVRIAALANAGFPSLARVAPLLGTIDHDAEYEFGLEALITAMQSRLHAA